MSNLLKIAAALGLVIALIGGALAYSVFRAPAEASAPIQAIPLAESPTQPLVSTAVAPSATSSAENTATEPAPTTAATVEASAASTETASEIVAQIVQAESEARFVIDEVLNDAPKTVVGTTNQVAGEIAVDPSDPTKSRIGVIQVNARGFTTDSDYRNRAIKNRILMTDQYEFITFTPTKLVGLPETAATGQSYSFTVVGDLTIRDVTRPVTFEVTATPESGTRLKGTANTTIRYADFGITIPQVRQVASVSDQVRLEIDFVATPA